MILHGALQKFEYLGENETKNKTILTHQSVAQASSNDEKNLGSKISLDCPFKLFVICNCNFLVFFVLGNISHQSKYIFQNKLTRAVQNHIHLIEQPFQSQVIIRVNEDLYVLYIIFFKFLLVTITIDIEGWSHKRRIIKMKRQSLSRLFGGKILFITLLRQLFCNGTILKNGMNSS